MNHGEIQEEYVTPRLKIKYTKINNSRCEDAKQGFMLSSYHELNIIKTYLCRGTLIVVVKDNLWVLLKKKKYRNIGN